MFAAVMYNKLMVHIHKMTKEEVQKLKAATLYIIGKCGEIDYFHLFKILYFADGEHLAYYGRRIINDTFCALPRGAVPSNLFDAIKMIWDRKNSKRADYLTTITDSLEVKDPTYYYILSAKEAADMRYLSTSDIEYLDKSIRENRNVDMNTLSEKSHDIAWQEAWNRRQSSEINPISMAKASGASDEMLAYIKEDELINALSY
jgi:uncharacterized phage-associated protein